jgi:hypothetical protein
VWDQVLAARRPGEPDDGPRARRKSLVAADPGFPAPSCSTPLP